MIILGINGFRGSGKDTAYGFLRDYAGGEENVRRRGFADKLKVMAAKALGFDGTPAELIDAMNVLKESGWVNTVLDADAYTPENESHLTGRKYLQLFGGKAREVFGDTFWIDQVIPFSGEQRARLWSTRTAFTDENIGTPTYAVITDVRYPNEAYRVLSLGGEVWEIVRPGIESDGDASEQPLPRELVTRKILNDGDINWFRSGVCSELALLAQNGGKSRAGCARA